MQSLADIQLLRERLGVSQKDLCEKADVSQSTLSRAKTLGREPTKRIRRKLETALEAIADERGITLVERSESDQ